MSTAGRIPQELLERPQWVLWRRETVNGRPTKVPYKAASPSAKASTTDAGTWSSYETAVAAASFGGSDGIGFVFSDADPLAGVDLDHVIDEKGGIEPKAASIIEKLDSYTEVSPGARGVHIIIRASLNGGRRRTGNFESYDAGRFFCVTGRHLPGTPLTVNDRQEQLEAIRAAIFPPEDKAPRQTPPPAPPSADDRELLELARTAKNGAKFEALYYGSDHAYPSDSEADQALCNLLAFWLVDPDRIDRAFRGSARMREKWDSSRGESTYGEQTIARALEGRIDFYTPPRPKAGGTDYEPLRWGKESTAGDGQAKDDEAEKDSGDWEPLASHLLPAFPTHALPPAVENWVAAVSEEAQTPEDLAAMAALGVLSAAGMGAAVVDCGTWTEELALYLLTSMASGDRKSTVQRAAAKPLQALERERREDALPGIRESRSRREVLDQRVKALTKKVANGDDAVEEGELKKAVEELAAIGEPVVPRLLADDTTAEALAGLLASHGRIAIIASESALVDNLVGGRYSEGSANLHLLCAAYSGESVTIDRRGRDPEDLERPLVTVALAVQPHVLQALTEHPVARSQGLVARFAYSLPETHLGRRRIDSRPTSAEVHEDWAAMVRRVFNTPKSADTTDTTPADRGSVSSVSTFGVPRIALTAEAKALLDELREDLEPRLGATGDLRPVADWIARHPGRIARIAGLLHLAQHELVDPISETTMRNAVLIGEYLLAHGLGALTGPDPLARRALDWLAGKKVITKRELERGPLHGRGTADEAAVLAGDLERLGAIRPLPPPPASPGRPPSASYEVHPDLADTTDTKVPS